MPVDEVERISDSDQFKSGKGQDQPCTSHGEYKRDNEGEESDGRNNA
ncbi:hypothetical protein MPQ_1288 [Methylovorus sp. MP688]|nr:hypothetical protein MPQ_1288 [Methylovorus sp. MP688]